MVEVPTIKNTWIVVVVPGYQKLLDFTFILRLGLAHIKNFAFRIIWNQWTTDLTDANE